MARKSGIVHRLDILQNSYTTSRRDTQEDCVHNLKEARCITASHLKYNRSSSYGLAEAQHRRLIHS